MKSIEPISLICQAFRTSWLKTCSADAARSSSTDLYLSCPVNISFVEGKWQRLDAQQCYDSPSTLPSLSCCVLWIRVSLCRLKSAPKHYALHLDFLRSRHPSLLSIRPLGSLSNSSVNLVRLQNGGTNCPACRGQSTIVSPFRALQTVVDTLLRLAPHKARTEREREQADELYKVGQSLRVCLSTSFIS